MPGKPKAHTSTAILVALNERFGVRVNWDALSQFEGGQALVGYVPTARDGTVIGRSGVTLATGVDIGQVDAAQVRAFGLPPALEAKLLPFVGKIRQAALDALRDLGAPALEKAEADRLDQAWKADHLDSCIRRWDTGRPPGCPPFTGLTPAQQSVLFSRTWHVGKGMPGTALCKPWYDLARQGDWPAAEAALREAWPRPKDGGTANDWYRNRVGWEADLLKREREAALVG